MIVLPLCLYRVDVFSRALVCRIVYVFPIVLLSVCAVFFVIFFFFFFFFFFFSDHLCAMTPKRGLSERKRPGNQPPWSRKWIF